MQRQQHDVDQAMNRGAELTLMRDLQARLALLLLCETGQLVVLVAPPEITSSPR